MKPFDLEAALAGAPVVTRGGRPVTQLVTFDITGSDRLFGVVDGRIVRCWKVDGNYYSKADNDLDLFMPSEKRTLWVNLYPSVTNLSAAIAGGVYESEEHANSAVGDPNHRIGGKAWPLEVEM